jgi:hypothetical protein
MDGIILVIGFVAFAVAAIWWHYSRSSSLLEGWAAKNGYRLISQEYRSVFKGPFFWTSSEEQTVYYVTVEDRNGQRRSGWVRCGGWFWGLLSDNVEVRWDDG